MSNSILVDIEISIPANELLRFDYLKKLTKDNRSIGEIFVECAFCGRDDLIERQEYTNKRLERILEQDQK